MTYYDTTYTNGVIAVREKTLLKEKLLRLCEMNAEDAFRTLLESGFGGGAENAASVYEYENLIAAEERALDRFILEYAPSESEQAYLLSPRDFHNAKALLKATYLGTSAERLLAPEGRIKIALLESCVQSGDFTPLTALNAYLGSACEQTKTLLETDANGAKVGEIFEKALYSYLWATAKKSSVLKKLLIVKADMTNVLTALRAGSKENAQDKYLPVGSLKEKELDVLFSEDEKKILSVFSKTPYRGFVESCLAAKAKGLPMTQAEKTLGSYDAQFFAERRFELSRNEPFLYYVFRRRAENANVRIVFVCLLAGQNEHDIKQRLRAV